MRLRRQLILVSLLTLSLPWAGCQYIQEMESALRQGQVIALDATAQAVASRIASEPRWVARLQQERWQQDANAQLYLHPISAPMQLDGYDDDWRALAIKTKDFRAALPAAPAAEPVSLSLRVARQQGSLLLFAYIEDNHIRYHHPGTVELASGDHLRLRTLMTDSALPRNDVTRNDDLRDPVVRNDAARNHVVRDYVIRSGAPGEITAFYRDEHQRIRQEHRIVGEWQEHGRGFQVEVRVPLDLLGDRLGVALVDMLSAGKRYDDERLGQRPPVYRWLGTVDEHSAPPYWSSLDDELTRAVAVFARDDLRLQVVSVNQWLLAEAGSLEQPLENQAVDTLPEQHGLILWLYRLALSNERLPPLLSSRDSGQVDAAEVTEVLRGNRSSTQDKKAAQGWYQWGKQRVGRAAVPVLDANNQVVAVVVAEQSSDTVLALTNTAFNRLFFYTLLATGITGLGLLSYASWLSLRIRRLSRAAASAIDDSGRIRDSFPRSRAADEVGDLTRNYGALLARLREYTDYLRTLSGKLSHELRTPLAVVRSSLDNLEHEPLSAAARRFSQRAQEGSARLSNILNAMSSASRVEESIRQAELESFSLAALVRSLGAAYGDMLEQQQRKVEVQVVDSVGSATITGSPDLLVQMLDKLVENAADFCPPHGSIRLQLAEAPAEWLLSVSNDGPLLPEQMQGQLFDSLVSVRSVEYCDHKTHLGLGLHIVRLIVEFHGGRIHARNRRDSSGVEFEVRLPKRLG